MLIQYFNLNFIETPYEPSPFSPLLFFPCSRVVSEHWVLRDRHKYYQQRAIFTENFIPHVEESLIILKDT